jgi:NTP pyrophosphatase (non-canonical NTP hydrolase)
MITGDTRMDIGDVQERAWSNKLAKGFSTDNVPQEFVLTYGELAEAFDAYRKNPAGLGSELADVVIYVSNIASMCGISLAAAVRDKLAVNASRTYSRNGNGVMVKEEVPQ